MPLLRIELDIKVRNYTAEEAMAEGCSPELSRAVTTEELDAYDVAMYLTDLFGEDSEAVRDAFAGSDIFVKVGEATLIRAEIRETES